MSFLGEGDRTVMVQAPTELGPYRLTKLLGRGGMGEVWQAFDNNLERDVAVKLMRKELLANEEAVKRFAREARAVARLNHPNIVQVYTFGDEQGVLYFVMELVEGETITQRMKQCGTVSLNDCVFMLLQAVEGLSYANARGIIHRDIKPSNLMLTPDYRLKIADFGLAKMIEHDTQMTAAGTTMGSPNYMSPEQAKGEEADHRSDIYALGISFYQMLTGTLPFTAELPISVLLKQIQEPLPEPLPLQTLGNGRVLEVLKKMTQKDPEQRYQTYGGLAAAISSLAPDVRVKGGHVSTTTMPTPDVPGAASTPSPAPATEVFGGEPKPAIPAGATEPMVQAGAFAQPSPNATPTNPQPLQGALQPEIGSTKTAMSTASAPTIPPVRTTLFMIAAAAGTAAVVALGALWLFHQMQQKNNEPAKSEIAAKPAITEAAPSPSPAATGTPVATASPTAVVTSRVSPTPAIAVAAPTAAVTAAPTVIASSTPPAVPAVFTPTPSPTPIVYTNSQIILGGIGIAANTPVALRDVSGNIVATLKAGTSLPLMRLEGTGASARYIVNYQGQSLFLAFGDGQPQLAGAAPVASQPSANDGFVRLVLGTRGGAPSESIDIYRENKPSGHPSTTLPSGTEVILLDSDSIMYHIQMSDGKQGYILKGSASKKP